MHRRLRFDQVERHGVRLVRVHGDVDIASAAAFSAAMAEPGNIIVDLTNCSYLDSSGLSVLVVKSKTVGRRVRVLTPEGSFFRKLFDVTGLDRRIVVLFESEPDAIAWLRASRGTTGTLERSTATAC